MSYIISAIIILITVFTVIIVNSFDNVVVIQNDIAEESEVIEEDEYEEDEILTEIEVPEETPKENVSKQIEPIAAKTAEVKSVASSRSGLIQRKEDKAQVIKTDEDLIVKAGEDLPDIKTLVIDGNEPNQPDATIESTRSIETASLTNTAVPVEPVVATKSITPAVESITVSSQVTLAASQRMNSQPININDSERTIKWPTRNQRWHSDDLSYKALFELWGFNYNKVEHGSPCSFAKEQGFKCHRDQYGLKSLRELNRPAVLTLYDDYDQLEYVLIKSLSESEAKLVIAGEEQVVPISQLMAHWKGAFSIIWQIPDGYFQPIVPGDSGRVVLWLNERMLDIKHRPGIIPHNYYDDSLLEQVKSFQLKQGLDADGVIGIRTLIHINQATSQKIPILEST